MSEMMPPQGAPPQGGPDLQMLLAQLGGQGEAPESPEEGSNWLVDAINAVHEGLVEETDPKQVSMLGKIMDLLTTFQATAHDPKATGG